MRVVDRITVLNFGRKIAEGDPVSVRNNPEVIKAYLGERLSKRLVAMPLLEITNLCAAYGDGVEVLHGIDLTVEKASLLL